MVHFKSICGSFQTIRVYTWAMARHFHLQFLPQCRCYNLLCFVFMHRYDHLFPLCTCASASNFLFLTCSLRTAFFRARDLCTGSRELTSQHNLDSPKLHGVMGPVHSQKMIQKVRCLLNCIMHSSALADDLDQLFFIT